MSKESLENPQVALFEGLFLSEFGENLKRKKSEKPAA